MPGVVVPPNWLSPSHGVTPSLSSRWSGKSPLSFENLRTGLKRGTCNDKGQAKPSPNVKAQMTNEIQNPNDKDFITPLTPLILRLRSGHALRGGQAGRLPRGVHPEQNRDSSPSAQNDKRRRARNDDSVEGEEYEAEEIAASFYRRTRNDDSLEGWSHHSRAF